MKKTILILGRVCTIIYKSITPLFNIKYVCSETRKNFKFTLIGCTLIEVSKEIAIIKTTSDLYKADNPKSDTFEKIERVHIKDVDSEITETNKSILDNWV